MLEIRLFTLVAIAVLAIAVFLYVSPFAACRTCPAGAAAASAAASMRLPHGAPIPEGGPVTILVVLICAVVAAGLAVLAAVLYGSGGFWLVLPTARSRHAQPRRAVSAPTPGATAAPEESRPVPRAPILLR